MEELIKLRVLHSRHSAITVGMTGTGIRFLKGYAVTFKNVSHQCVINEQSKIEDTCIYFLESEVEVIE